MSISGMYAYLTVSPFLFQNILGLSPSAYGKLSLCTGAAILISGYINTQLIKRWTLDILIFVGAGIIISAGVLLWCFTYIELKSVFFTLLPILLFFFCNTIGWGNATSKSLSYLQGSFGTARALLTTGQFFAGALGSFIFSMLPVKDGLYLSIWFIINGILMFICALLAQRASERQRVVSSSAITCSKSLLIES
jgi:DHA1 family bicyclomycin/chloramphenicol resistance-like MFS transporter/DHA1 family 2-module integral membrane pump EmrD-like MFS transporter